MNLHMCLYVSICVCIYICIPNRHHHLCFWLTPSLDPREITHLHLGEASPANSSSKI